MERLTQSHSVSVHWRSYQLRPKGVPPPPPEYLERIQAARPQLYAVARQQYGLEMNPGPFGVDTRPALIGAKVAEANGVGPAYHERIMRAYWQEAAKIDDLQQLSDLAVEAGVEREVFQAALNNADYDRQVQDDIDTAAAYGLSGVPALVFEERYLVSGAQPLHVLQQVVAQVESKRNAAKDE